jgi:alanyl-tRNA synthetase
VVLGGKYGKPQGKRAQLNQTNKQKVDQERILRETGSQDAFWRMGGGKGPYMQCHLAKR